MPKPPWDAGTAADAGAEQHPAYGAAGRDRCDGLRRGLDRKQHRGGRCAHTEGAGSSLAGGSTQTRVILVVPDGVARVAFVFPRQADRNDPGARVDGHSVTMTAAVHGNVVALQVPRECCGSDLRMIWYAGDGHVVKRFGRLAAVDRVARVAKPGPETRQSHAAERDPSMPNHVWVTAATGGRHTSYTLHFRMLLSDADYRSGSQARVVRRSPSPAARADTPNCAATSSAPTSTPSTARPGAQVPTTSASPSQTSAAPAGSPTAPTPSHRHLACRSWGPCAVPASCGPRALNDAGR